MKISCASTRISVLVSLLISLFFTASFVAAHPLDEFFQVTFISVGSEQVSLTVEFYAGVLVAPQVIELIDADADELFSAHEQQSYAQRFIDDVSLRLDDVAVPLAIERVEFPPALELQAGVGVIRMFLTGDISGASPGSHEVFYANNHFPDVGVYLVSALSDDPQAVEITSQKPDVYQKSVLLAVNLHNAAPTQVQQNDKPAEGRHWLIGLYDAELPSWVALLASSIALGGLHAFSGSGRLLVAAYFVGNRIGSRVTVQHAVFLGGIITFTHTISVITIGLVALLASQYIVPDILIPALDLLSGILVVWFGFWMIWSRWRVYQKDRDRYHHVHNSYQFTGSHTYEYYNIHKNFNELSDSNNIDDSVDNNSDGNGDDNLNEDCLNNDKSNNKTNSGVSITVKNNSEQDIINHRHQDMTNDVGLRYLLAPGIFGGLISYPEALGIMLIAIGLNRILLGLGMVISFSFGLAAVLAVIGVLLERAKLALYGMSRGGQRWKTLLPLISAVIIILLGIGITLRAVL